MLDGRLCESPEDDGQRLVLAERRVQRGRGGVDALVVTKLQLAARVPVRVRVDRDGPGVEGAAGLAHLSAAAGSENHLHTSHWPAIAVLDADGERRVGERVPRPPLAAVTGHVAQREVMRARAEDEPERTVLSDRPRRRAQAVQRRGDLLLGVRVGSEHPDSGSLAGCVRLRVEAAGCRIGSGLADEASAGGDLERELRIHHGTAARVLDPDLERRGEQPTRATVLAVARQVAQRQVVRRGAEDDGPGLVLGARRGLQCGGDLAEHVRIGPETPPAARQTVGARGACEGRGRTRVERSAAGSGEHNLVARDRPAETVLYADDQLAWQQRAGPSLLAVAGHVAEHALREQVHERHEGRPAVVDGVRLHAGRGPFDDRERTEVVVHVARRRLGENVHPSGVRAGRERPVVTCLEVAAAEADLHAVLEGVPARGHLHDALGVCVPVLVPAPHARVPGHLEGVRVRWKWRLDLDRALAGVDVVHAHERAGAALELRLVVENLDPVVLGEAKHVVIAQAAEPDPVGGRVVEARHRERDGAVVARPLERGVAAHIAAVVDLDPVEAVLEGCVAAAGRHEAEILGVGTGSGARAETAAPSRRDQRVDVLAARLARGDPHLAHRLDARCGVGAQQGLLADLRVLDRRHVALPDVEVDEVGAVGHGRGRVRQLGLGHVGERAPCGRVLVHRAELRWRRRERDARFLDVRDPEQLRGLAGGIQLQPVALHDRSAVEDGGRQLDLVRRREADDRQPLRLELTEQPADVDAAVREAEVGSAGVQRLDGEAAAVLRSPAHADDVPRLGAFEVLGDLLELVPVGIELHAALLEPHGGEPLARPEREAGVVGFHCSSPIT